MSSSLLKPKHRCSNSESYSYIITCAAAKQPLQARGYSYLLIFNVKAKQCHRPTFSNASLFFNATISFSFSISRAFKQETSSAIITIRQKTRATGNCHNVAGCYSFSDVCGDLQHSVLPGLQKRITCNETTCQLEVRSSARFNLAWLIKALHALLSLRSFVPTV